MNHSRRALLRGSLSVSLLSVALAAGLLQPRRAEASAMKTRLRQSLLDLRQGSAAMTAAIRVNAPDIAENGASVFIDFACALPDVDALFIFVEQNPQPLVAAFQIAPEVVPAMQMRIKVSRTSRVWVMARSAGRFFKAAKAVTVTAGGCGVGEN